jgi:hypothetical protein
VGLDRVAGAAKEPRQRLEVANKAWAAWTPVNLAGIGAHLAGGAVLLAANKGRVASQAGVGRAATVKIALTAAALAATAYSRLLGHKLEHASTAPVADATTPAEETPPAVAGPQRQLRALQWIIPAFTGAILSSTPAWASSSARPGHPRDARPRRRAAWPPATEELTLLPRRRPDAVPLLDFGPGGLRLIPIIGWSPDPGLAPGALAL